MTVIQDALDLGPVVEVVHEEGMTLAEWAAQWIAANQHIVDEFERRTARLVAAGRTRIGVKMLAESIRYETMLRAESDPFRVNNSAVSFVARELIRRHPDWAPLIETRALASERAS